jgi:hypothetical protein
MASVECFITACYIIPTSFRLTWETPKSNQKKESTKVNTESQKMEEKELTVLKFCIEMKPFLLGPNNVNCSRRKASWATVNVFARACQNRQVCCLHGKYLRFISKTPHQKNINKFVAPPAWNDFWFMMQTNSTQLHLTLDEMLRTWPKKKRKKGKKTWHLSCN